MNSQDEFDSYRKRTSGRGSFEKQYSKIIRTWNKVVSDSTKEIEEGRDPSRWRQSYSDQHTTMLRTLESFNIKNFDQEDRDALKLYKDALVELYDQTADEPGKLDAVGYAVVELENLLNAE